MGIQGPELTRRSTEPGSLDPCIPDPDSVRFYYRRNPLPATDAGGREPALESAAAQFEEQRQQQTRAGHAERMAEGDGAAVHVDLVAIQPQFLLDRQVLRGERLVDLDEVEVA